MAQRYGQWSWNGALTVGRGVFKTALDGEDLDKRTQDDLRILLGIHGYIVHPAIARFQLSTDLRFADIEGGTLASSDDLGLRADFEITPRGPYPSRFFFERQLFDFTLSEEETGSFLLQSLPDTLTRWGGRMAVARGPLTGLKTGFQFSTADFVDPDSGQETNDSQYVDWSRKTRRINHNVRLEHRDQTFSALRASFEDLILSVIERGDLNDDWWWQLTGSGFHRSVGLPADGDFSAETFRVNNGFVRQVNGDRLDLRQSVSYFSSGSSSITQAGLTATYDWLLRSGLTLSPFGSFAYQTDGGERSLSEPRLGTGLSWIWRGHKLQSVVNARVSYGRRDLRDDSLDEEERQFAYALSGSLSHSTKGGLSEQIEAEILHNELRQFAEPITDLPDLGLRRGLGAEDSYRLRLSAGKRWRRYALNGYGEWYRREDVTEGVETRTFESETLSANLGFSGPMLSLTGSIGTTEIFQDVVGDQEVDFQAVSLRLRPWRFLNVTASWRSDTRRLPLLVDYDGERLEGQLQLRIGQIYMSGKLYEVRRIMPDGSERIDTGLGWSISRGIAGWLPIVSAVERRGTIR